jgi:hypothetical protein
MTIELKLPPDLESFARSRALEMNQGNIAEFVNDLLRREMALADLDEVESKLLDAVDAPSVPFTEAVWDNIRQRAITGS